LIVRARVRAQTLLVTEKSKKTNANSKFSKLENAIEQDNEAYLKDQEQTQLVRIEIAAKI
jgi:hypothetical protein